MKQFYIIIIFFFTSFLGIGQTTIEFDVLTKEYQTDKKISGVTVEIYDGSTLLKTLNSPSNGNVKFSVPAGKMYKVEFSKQGKVSRFVMINGKDIDAEYLQGGSFAKAKFEVSLFDQVPNVDFSYVENNPFTEYYFDGTSIEMKFDAVIAQRMQKKIADLLKKSEEQKGKVDELYANAIQKADEWYKQKNWTSALDKYTEAATLKPNEKYPKDRILELDELIKKQKTEELAGSKTEEDYKKLISTADALRDQKKYTEAIGKYNEAIKLKNEAYPKEQITKINGLIEAEKNAAATEAAYKKAIDNGESYLSQKKYLESKTAFNEALKVRANDPLATKKLAEIDAKIKQEADLANKKKNYDAKIAEAEQLFTANKFPEAKAKFIEAKAIDNSQTLPDQRLKEIDEKIAEYEKNKAKIDKYNATMKSADDLMKENKLVEAKNKYKEALSIDNTQTKPSENIGKIDQMLADQEKAKKEKEKTEKVAQLLKEAAAIYAKNELDNAKIKYQEVLNIENSNSEAKAKINEINQKQGDAEKNKKFNDLKSKGMSLLQQQKFVEAKATLEEAKSIKLDTEVETKLKEIETKLAELEKNKAKQAQYNTLIENADNLYNSNKLVEAKAKYQEALAVDGSQQKPKDIISKIDKTLADQDKVAKERTLKIENGLKEGAALSAKNDLESAKQKYQEVLTIDPSNTEAKAKVAELTSKIAANQNELEKNKKFNELKANGLAQMQKQQWTEARNTLSEAKAIKSDAEVDAKIKEIDAKLFELEKAKGKSEQFNSIMLVADNLFNSNKLAEAKVKYQEALTVDPSQQKPKDNIAKIDKILAEQEKNAKDKALKIEALLKDGGLLYTKKEWENAKIKYQEVLNLDPINNEAKTKLDEINSKILADKDQNEKNKQFNDLKNKGLNFMQQQKWEEAKTSFKEAKSIKTDTEIDVKLKEIDNKLAELEKNKNINEQYNAIIEIADNLYNSNKLLEAKAKYQEALKLDASQQKPKDNIAKIDKTLADQENASKEKEKRIEKLLDEGITLYGKNELVASKSKYEEVLKLDPSNLEAKTKINDLNNKINASAEDEIKNKEYLDLKNKGLSLMQNQKWIEAKDAFIAAKKIKSDPEIETKLIEIENKIKELQDKFVSHQTYTKLINEAKTVEVSNIDLAISKYKEALKVKPNEVLPQTKIKELEALKANKQQQQEIDEKYKEAIQKGDNQLLGNKYTEAIKFYNEAGSLKPDEKEPIEKAALARKKADDDRNDEKNQYDKILNAGQKAIVERNWTKAKEMYNRAIKFNPDDELPKQKLKEIEEKILAEEKNKSAEAELNTAFNEKMNEGNRAADNKDYDQAIKFYEEARKLKPTEKAPPRKLEEMRALKSNKSQNTKSDRRYEEFIKKGDLAFEKKNYNKAISEYKNALDVRKNDEIALTKLAEAKRLIDQQSAKPKEAGKLENLGTPTTESVDKVNEELIKADLIRKSKRDTKVANKGNRIQDSENESTTNKTNDLQNSSVDLIKIEKDNFKVTAEVDKNRQGTIDSITFKEKNYSATDFESSLTKYGTLKNTEDQAKTTQIETSKYYNEKDTKYNYNNDSIARYETNDVNRKIGEDKANYNKNLKGKETVSQIELSVESKTIDDFNERKAIDNNVIDLNKVLIKQEGERITSESDNIDEIATKVEKERLAVSIKEEKDSRAAGAHGQDIETIEANIQNTDISKDDKNVKKNYQTTSVVSDKQKAISKLPNEQDANRIKNTDGVKKGSFAIDDQTRNEYNANIKKNIESDQNLNQNKKTFDKIEENQSKNPKEIAIDIKTLEYNSTASIQSTEENDDEQREKTNESIISTESTYSSESTDKSKKVDNNIKSVQDVSSNTSDKKEAEELAKQKKLEQIQVNLNKLSSKELKFSDKIANDLGSSYPEGVSQEVFNQNDEDGLLIAVVTRRIVVKNGYGQVYLRTQSLNGLTYSKNGDPSSEFVWQRETQDSKLKKNY